MRVLVCGGRDYSDRDHVHNVLCKLDFDRGPITCVIHGAAKGTGNAAMHWAQVMGEVGNKTRHQPFLADWRAHGRAAGPMRNQRMIDEGKPDLVVAFPGGRGTADMICRAKAHGIEVIEIPARNA